MNKRRRMVGMVTSNKMMQTVVRGGRSAGPPPEVPAGPSPAVEIHGP